MATRKNFIENGRRADPMGSNPHSYGLVFSEYVFSWGSQNAISTCREARVWFLNSVSVLFCTVFRGFR